MDPSGAFSVSPRDRAIDAARGQRYSIRVEPADLPSISLPSPFTVTDVLARNDAEALRLFVRANGSEPAPVEVTAIEGGRPVFPGIDEAERKVDYLYTTLARVEGQTVSITPASAVAKEYQPTIDEIAKLDQEGQAAVENDSAAAVNHAFRLAAIINESMDLMQRRKTDRPSLVRASYLASRALTSLCDALGILRTPAARYFARTRTQRLSLAGLDVATIDEKVQARVAARQAKDFAKADAIRAELEALGIELFDQPTGSTWKKRI
jgi:cysteinyl-tRNA synthetase